MNDWLHCNKCSLRFQPNIKFFLVECGHIFCENNCIKLVQNSKCLVCGKANGFIMPIDKEMQPNTQLFFIPLDTQVKKYVEQGQKLVEVANFQGMHRQKLYQTINHKYQFLKKEIYNYHQRVKGLHSENKIMRTMLLNNNRGHPGGGFAPVSTPSMTADDTCDGRSEISMASFEPVKHKRPVPGYAHRMAPNPEHSGEYRGFPNPHNQPHLFSAPSAYRPATPASSVPSNHRRFQNMASVHKPSTATSMDQLYGKRP